MRDPEASIADIVAYAERALGYVSTLDRTAFLQATAAQDGVIRCLEVIGEAAKRVPVSTRRRYPRVPWPQMAGMRNRLAHEYDAVDMESVWVTLMVDLPQILSELSAPTGPGSHA